jgi:inorganic pyrophosphatase/exopolyphosphatase
LEKFEELVRKDYKHFMPNLRKKPLGTDLREKSRIASEPDEPEKDKLKNDQDKRKYYYDDAYGYEDYEPEEDDEAS